MRDEWLVLASVTVATSGLAISIATEIRESVGERRLSSFRSPARAGTINHGLAQFPRGARK